MFDVGPMEFAVIIVVALLVIGPERIPEVARTLGRFIGQLRQIGGDIGDPIQQVREALHEGIQEGEALAHQIQADVEAVHGDLQSAADLANDPAVAGQPAAAEPATVQPAAATGVVVPAPDPAAAALRDTAREAAAVMAASSADTAPHDDDLGDVDLTADVVPTDTAAVDELDPVQQAIATIEANEEYAPVEPEAGEEEETSDGTTGDDATDDDELDPVQQAIAAIEANEDYAPVELEATAEATSDGNADGDDAAEDDSYDPVLDTLASKVGDLSQDTDGAAVSVGHLARSQTYRLGTPRSGGDDVATAAASVQDDAGFAADTDVVRGDLLPGARPPKQTLPIHRQPPRPLWGLTPTAWPLRPPPTADAPLYTEVALPTTPTETGGEPNGRSPADGIADSGSYRKCPRQSTDGATTSRRRSIERPDRSR